MSSRRWIALSLAALVIAAVCGLAWWLTRTDGFEPPVEPAAHLGPRAANAPTLEERGDAADGAPLSDADSVAEAGDAVASHETTAAVVFGTVTHSAGVSPAQARVSAIPADLVTGVESELSRVAPASSRARAAQLELRRVLSSGPSVDCDVAGRYSLAVPPGDLLVWITLPDSALVIASRHVFALAAGERRRVDLALPDVATLEGRVMSSSDVAIADAHVELTPSRLAGTRGEARRRTLALALRTRDLSVLGTATRTDSEGRFRVELPSVEPFDVAARAPSQPTTAKAPTRRPRPISTSISPPRRRP